MSSQSTNAQQGKYFEHLIVCANPSPKSFEHAIVEARHARIAAAFDAAERSTIG